MIPAVARCLDAVHAAIMRDRVRWDALVHVDFRSSAEQGWCEVRRCRCGALLHRPLGAPFHYEEPKANG